MLKTDVGKRGMHMHVNMHDHARTAVLAKPGRLNNKYMKFDNSDLLFILSCFCNVHLQTTEPGCFIWSFIFFVAVTVG